MRISTFVVGLLLTVAFAIGARPAAAQQLEGTAAVVDAGPTLQAASVALRSPATELSGTLALQQRTRRSTTLMIVGGGILVAGALIGGDAGAVIMIGGAAVALYGLYIYLDQGRIVESAAPLPAQAF